MPKTAESIFQQLGLAAEPIIPEQWDTKLLKPGDKIGEPKLLFSNIPASKVEEWREAFGGDEVRKQKELAAEKAAAKKAAKDRKKAKKAAGAAPETAPAAAGVNVAVNPSVEAVEKHDEADPRIEGVTKAVEQADIHTS